MYSYGPSHMVEQMQDDQLEHTYSSYVRIQDVALKTCQRRWTIGRSGEIESGISVLAARHDDDDYKFSMQTRVPDYSDRKKMASRKVSSLTPLNVKKFPNQQWVIREIQINVNLAENSTRIKQKLKNSTNISTKPQNYSNSKNFIFWADTLSFSLIIPAN